MSDQDERIEELESKVGRLEATVQGLTEELVEVHDRLETLESEAASSGGREESEQSAPARARETECKNEGAKSDESQKEDETGDDSELGDDIIVA